ncbi:MAG: hypothetical protein ABR905_17595 [Terracidiphilus sp.]|jgi:hypothetical protein
MSNILLIDDDAGQVHELKDALDEAFRQIPTTVELWVPGSADRPEDIFSRLVTPETAMVVTDYDLTGNGKTGFFGSAIVDWCKAKFIPVGDYSRGGALHQLPKETDQYEIRIPSNSREAAVYIRQVHDGFQFLRLAVEERWDTLSAKRSPAAILAEILDRPIEETRFALYGTKLGSANAALMSEISRVEQRGDAVQEMKRFFPYVLGHLLLNVILRFPGPILHLDALAAFLAIARDEIPTVVETFSDARYRGPFGGLQPYYWTSGVEQILSSARDALAQEDEAETIGELNRLTLQRMYNKEFRLHGCNRCGGRQGGLFCPFTKKTICQRADCSVPSNAWIPQGARLCRIEKDFYDEWAPLLGF